LRPLCTALQASTLMIEPGRATRTTAQFVLRPDFPNVFVTDADGRDRYWVRSGVADHLGLWSLRDLTGRELLSVQLHQSWPLPACGVYRAGQRVATVRELAGGPAARWLAAVRAIVAGTTAKLRYTVETTAGDRLEVAGEPDAVEYHFTRAGRPAATVGMQWLSWASTFGLTVRVGDGEDAVLILAVTTMIESSLGRL
jgi:hypothetical protein